MKSENKLIGVGLLTAITASLCCLTPVLALVAGASGIVSSFSWVGPFRPYLIGLTILVIGFAWYQKLKPQKAIDCECETDEKPKFLHSKSFLAIVTAFVIIMLAFPYYSRIFYTKNSTQIIVLDKSDSKTIEFEISGMTCASCEEHINHEVNKLNGIVNSNTSYENGSAIIEFDGTKTNKTQIEKAINSAGYKAISKNDKEWKSN
jgi:copper chaperone CopZ